MTKEISSFELVKILMAVCDEIIASKDYLCELDGAIGDGDHGIGMAKSFMAVKEMLEDLQPENLTPADVFEKIGMDIVSSAGGAMGPLFGGAFIRGATAINGKPALGLHEAVAVLNAGEEAIRERGKVIPGDKTMLDTIYPAAQALAEAAEQGMSFLEAGKKCVEAARSGMVSTKDMISKRGRSSRLGERTVGHQDAGATSAYIMLNIAFAEFEKIYNA